MVLRTCEDLKFVWQCNLYSLLIAPSLIGKKITRRFLMRMSEYGALPIIL